MRVFAGIALDAKMKNALAQAALEARKLFPGRYAPRDNYHCTLQFIGQADAAMVLAAEKAVREAAADSSPFLMSLTGLSFFRRPQDAVLFCGISESAALLELARTVRERLSAVGFILEEAAFHPHITLARQAKLNTTQLSMIPVVQESLLVEEITLFESRRVEEQLRYVPLLSCPLGK